MLKVSKNACPAYESGYLLLLIVLNVAGVGAVRLFLFGCVLVTPLRDTGTDTAKILMFSARLRISSGFDFCVQFELECILVVVCLFVAALCKSKNKNLKEQKLIL